MKINFVSSPKHSAQAALQELTAIYGQVAVAEADYIVALGGDGTVLRGLHGALAGAHQPVFAMRLEGSLGALANRYSPQDLPERLHCARRVVLHPLKAEASCRGGHDQTVIAINEIVLSRQRLQAAKIRVTAAARELPMLIGDGLIIASAVGSSGYNHSAGGPCLPYTTSSLPLTAVALHRCSKWSNMVVDDATSVEIEVTDPEFRPVRLETSTTELRDVRSARVSCCRNLPLTLLFDPDGP